MFKIGVCKNIFFVLWSTTFPVCSTLYCIFLLSWLLVSSLWILNIDAIVWVFVVCNGYVYTGLSRYKHNCFSTCASYNQQIWMLLAHVFCSFICFGKTMLINCVSYASLCHITTQHFDFLHFPEAPHATSWFSGISLQVELVCRVCLVLLQTHHNQLTATPAARSLLTELKDILYCRVKVI